MEEKKEDHLSSDVIKAISEEINDPRRDLQLEVYMTWSRRRN